MAEAKAKQKKPVTTVRDYFGIDAVAGYQDAALGKEEGLSTRLIGIEVEVENHELQRHPRDVWISTDDGSLRNNGLEWITRPITANQARGALNNLLVESLSQDCCFSPRTSVHVHVNCQDVPIEKIPNIVCLYAVLEPLFYRYAGRSRNKNIFCVPVLETNLITAIQNKGLNFVVGEWSKYSGLNLVPLGEKGTIEFRHMHGTNDVNKLVKWVDMLTKLVDFVVKSETGELSKVLFDFNETFNVKLMLLDIFGLGLQDCLQYYDYSTIRESVTNMKQAFISKAGSQQVASERSMEAAFYTTRVKGI